ncbi:hypothetical protein [Tabrizicola sp.]|uniref:hypothetical protein n=1 Tax=Tabrizicola sp. TaxID=2005166 RepID=UPI00261E80CE|nr:hypothetical protein [Tabrizicola sp.]MDM7930871.1 hypothetical protein [Tabrizicola sp.]
MSKALRCLVVGIPAATFPEGSIRAQEAASIPYSDLPDYFAQLAGLELVVVPLFCDAFDALEIIELLGAQGYRGLLRIAAPKLPNRAIVLRELRSHAAKQGMTLELLEDV